MFHWSSAVETLGWFMALMGGYQLADGVESREKKWFYILFFAGVFMIALAW